MTIKDLAAKTGYAVATISRVLNNQPNVSEKARKAILQAAQESWVKVEDGRGNTVFSRVLVPGDVYYVPNGDKYKATFGNAGGVDIWVDGVRAPDAGPDHTRKSGISLTPESLIVSK